MNRICPVAPAGISRYTDMIGGNVVWVVIWLFGIAFAVSVGAMLVGRIMHMQHLSKAGALGLAGVVVLAVILAVLGGLLTAIIGSGCIG